MYVKPFVIGALTYLPGFEKLIAARGTGGSDSARYCYGVWLKHLVMLWEGGMRSMPRTLAELGPGDTLGVGLAAMLSGVDEYYALDVIEYAHRDDLSCRGAFLQRRKPVHGDDCETPVN